LKYDFPGGILLKIEHELNPTIKKKNHMTRKFVFTNQKENTFAQVTNPDRIKWQ
jgi:hypothetical protein